MLSLKKLLANKFLAQSPELLLLLHSRRMGHQRLSQNFAITEKDTRMIYEIILSEYFIQMRCIDMLTYPEDQDSKQRTNLSRLPLPDFLALDQATGLLRIVSHQQAFMEKLH